jgi:hypothetical protein
MGLVPLTCKQEKKMQVLAPFPEQIDNTIRSTWRACQRKFWIRHLLHRDHPLPSVHLHAGGAFAKGVEVTRKAYFRDGVDADTAIVLGWQALHEEYGDFDSGAVPNKSAFKMGAALVSYFDEYPLALDSLQPAMFNGQPAIEFTFALPLPINHPTTGQPILYCGRFDMLAKSGDQLFVVDEKTTTRLGDFWAKRYELSAQFTGYCWAARQHGFPVVGALIRGIGILSKEIKHSAVPLFRPDFMIQEWYHGLLRDINDMIASWILWTEEGEKYSPWYIFKPDYADACGSYGGCQFASVCNSHPATRDKILEVNYATRIWTPLKGENDGE